MFSIRSSANDDFPEAGIPEIPTRRRAEGGVLEEIHNQKRGYFSSRRSHFSSCWMRFLASSKASWFIPRSRSASGRLSECYRSRNVTS
jgi:hypothetical protein